MLIADAHEPTTLLFPHRVPEEQEAMTSTESAALAAWQDTPTGRGTYAAIAAHAAERLAIDGGHVLSVGEGEGRLASTLALQRPGLEVVGTDVCPQVVSRAAERHLPSPFGNLTYEVASAYDLGRYAGRFDAVICALSFHHLHDPQLGLREMVRCLVPGGRLFVLDLRRDADAGPYFRTLDAYVSASPPVAKLFRDSIAASHTVEELRDLLAQVRGTRHEVGPVRWGSAALEAFAGEDPEGALLAQHEVSGLWVEALLVR